MQNISHEPAPPDTTISGPPPARPVRLRSLRRRGVLGALAALVLVSSIVGGTVGRELVARPAAAQAIGAPPKAALNLNTTSTLQAAIIAVAQNVGPAVVSIRTEQGLGSGVIYDSSGLVLTNNHVVDGATSITVGLSDGRHFDGKVLGQDPGFDLAVVKIDGQTLPGAPLGSSASLQAGEFVVAIGNPYGFDHTVTTGVISAVNRPVSVGQGSYNQPMIQTDAAINPGNSGGPLVDLQGNVVGITTLVAAPQGFPAQGLGFAVPVDTAKRIAPQLATDGHVSHSGQPYLGVSLGNVVGPDSLPGYPGVPQRGPRPTAPAGGTHGAVVGQVAPNGPAAQAGLQSGDVITSFGGKDMWSADDLLQNLVLHKPGDQIQVGVTRNGQVLTPMLILGEAPAAA